MIPTAAAAAAAIVLEAALVAAMTIKMIALPTPTNLRCKKVYFPMAASRYYYYSYYTTKACSITATSIPVIQPPWRQRSS